MATTHFTGHGGLKLAADIGGPVGEVPVLLHGGGQTRHSWRRAVRELVSMGYCVAAPDLRGHGDSAWADDGDYSLDAFAADVRAMAQSFSRPPALVGASLGGVSSLLAVGEHAAQGLPPLASALVLVDVVPRMSRDGIARIRGFMDGRPEGFASLDEAADAIAAYLPHRPRPKSLDGLRKNLRQGSDGRWRWHWDPAFHSRRSPANVEAMAERMEAAARHVRVPTLIVRGRLSELVEKQAVDQLCRLIPQAEAVEVDGAAHMVAGDKNDAFNAAIEDFLRRNTRLH